MTADNADESATTPAYESPTPPPVEEQRAALAETVDALAHKADVPARVKSAAADTAHTTKVKAQETQQVLIGAGVAALSALIAVVVIRRRRKG